MRTIIMKLCAILLATLAAGAPGSALRAGDDGPGPHGSFVEDCSICHRADAWKPPQISPRFKHAPGRFPLQAAHAGAACRACHASLEFKQTKSACVDCHQDVHRGELGADCARCHTTRNFIERADDARRHRLTRFPLTGAHVAADCISCHPPAASGGPGFVNTPTNCDACHLQAYLATANPDHAASGFPRDCSQCHSTSSWMTSRFNHALTGFPLAGAHSGLECGACHVDNKFQGTNSSCVACHQADYDHASNPNHAAALMPTTCQDCHSVRAWRPASYDHARTGFPLTGAHRAQNCAACHGDGVYTGKSAACVSCHQQQYDATADPDHRALGFSTGCADCHTTTSWQGATFDHDAAFFPIYSGVHKGKWSSCSTCHLNPASYAEFSCFGCHPHADRTKTNENHSGVSGYTYASTACYTCHPRGRAEN